MTSKGLFQPEVFYDSMVQSLQNHIPFSVPYSRSQRLLASVPESGLNLVQNTSKQSDQSAWQVLWDPIWMKEHIYSIYHRKCAHLPQKHKTQRGATRLQESLANKKKGKPPHRAPSNGPLPHSYSHELVMTSCPAWQKAGKTHPGNQIIFTGKHCNKGIIHWIHAGQRGPVGSCILGRVEVYSCRGDHKYSWNL